MFEDKRYTNDNFNKNKFFMPEDNNGLREGNDNLNFNEERNYVPRVPQTSEVKKPKRFKGFAIFLIIVIVLVVLLITVFGIIHYLSSPSKIYLNVLDDTYNFTKAYLKEYDNNKLDFDVEEDILTNTGSFNFYTDYPEIDAFSSYNYDYKLVFDNKNKQFDANLTLKNDNNSLLALKSYLRNNKIYLQDSNIYSGIIEMGESTLNLSSFKNNYDYNDIINILECFKNTIIPYIVDDNLSKEKATIKINNKNVKVTSNVFSLTEKQVEEFLINFIDNLIDSGDALKSFANLTNSSRKEAIALLKEIKNKDEVFKDLKPFKMMIYTEGLSNEFRGFKINYDKSEIISFVKEEMGYNFEIVLGDIRLNVNKMNNKDDIKLYYLDDNILTATINKEEDTTITEFNILYEDSEGEEYEVLGTITYVSKKIGDKRRTHKLSVNVDMALDNKDYNFKLELNNTTQVGGKITNIDVSKARLNNELNNNELKSIDKNLKGALNRTPLYNLYESTIGKKIESKLYCDKAYDCACNENGCTCKYMAQFNVEKEVVCQI